MTAAKSTKKSFFKTRYLNSINDNKKQFIVNIVLEALGLPVLAIIAVILSYVSGDSYGGSTADANVIGESCIAFIIISFCTICGSVFMGCIIALAQFKYLYKKTITDMHYSLPLSGTQRFFADYLAGLTIYIAPVVGAVLLSLGIMGAGEIFIDMSDIWEIMPFILELALVVIVAMIQYYTISVFALTFCGNTFEANFSIFAFICMIPATIGCLWLAIIETSSFGIVSTSIFSKSIFTNTNPAGSFAFIVRFIDAYSDSYIYDESGLSSSVTSMCWRWVFGTLFVTVLYVAAAYLLHKHRKAEDVSKPYVYRAFFYAIMTMVVFCVLSLFITLDGFIFAGIVICAVIWFIMEVITRRGFKKFWTAFIGFGLSVISVFAICWICDISNGFGMSKRLPSASNIEYVVVNNAINDESVVYRDKEVINSTLELNKEMIDRYFNSENYTYDLVPENFEYDYTKRDENMVYLTYKTYTGSTVERRYYISSDLRSELIKNILLSDEYAEYAAQEIGFVSSYGDVITYNISITDRLKMNGVAGRNNMTLRQLNEIREAYIEDMKNMTEDELINGKVYCFLDDYWVLDSFENTKNAIDAEIQPITEESFSYNIVEIEKNPKYTTNINNYTQENEHNDSYYDYYIDDRYSLAFVDKITRIYPSYIYNYKNAARVSVNSRGVMDILQNCTPIIIEENPIAVIYINDYAFYLLDTPENQKLLENVYLPETRNNDRDNYYDYYGWDDEYMGDYEISSEEL